MARYAYYLEGISCPECGEVTYELFNASSGSGQEVLMCEGCYDDDGNMNYRGDSLMDD